MDNDCESVIENCTPPEITETAKAASLNLLPEKSKKNYEIAYRTFTDWRIRKNMRSFSENNVLAYFSELAQKYKSSSLWTIYSMLKTTLNIHHNINIANYPKLVSFLKRKSEGYKSKKAAIFTRNEVHEFIDKAPDNKYLATKVALIMGIMGCCRASELFKMKVQNVHDHNTAFLVDVLDTKNTKVDRQFSIREPFYNIVKQYISLRSVNTTTDKFFVNFQKGKCTIQTIGINKFRSIGKQVATYLKLPSPETYTGHSLKRSSATIYTDGGAGWKTSSTSEGYIERSQTNKKEACSSTHRAASMPVDCNAANLLNINNNSNISNLDMTSTPNIHVSNCNVTINFYSK